MRDEHFRLIRDAGFRHVRINLHPFRSMGKAPDFALPQMWLETLDWAIAECRRNGLVAVLDMHEYMAMADDPFGLKPNYLAFWRQLGDRYQNEPDDVVFEMLNEPNTKITPEIWNEFLKEPLAILRETNPRRTLVIGPASWNGIEALNVLQLPDDDRNIVVTVHYYHPMEFSHQGAHWSEFLDRSGIRWLGTDSDRLLLQTELGGAAEWGREHDRPIHLGEFGAYESADMASRVRYTAAVAREAERLGWSWSYWQFDSNFIAFDMGAGLWVEPILSALVPE